jgi:hypothetical protein
MSKNYNYIFTTGAPGSAWSMISHRLKKTFKGFDYSDETPERQYKLPDDHREQRVLINDPARWKAKTHVGAYFGPHHENGHHFDNLSYYTDVNDFYNECLKPFTDETAPRKLIRSHWFAYNLEWLWDNCKGNDILLIWRDPEAAKNWWYSMGGWNIKHPVYQWYDNDEKMWNQIQEESRLITEFGNSKNVNWHEYNYDYSWLENQFGESRKIDWPAAPDFKDIVKIGYLKIT